MIADYSQIPEATLETLTAWVKDARPLGTRSFCEALITNDLAEAFKRADEPNIRAMFHTMCWLHNRAPMAAWGSPAALKSWPRWLHEGEQQEGGINDQDEDPPCECVSTTGRWAEEETVDARHCPVHGPNSPSAKAQLEREAAEEAAYWRDPGWKEVFKDGD